MKITSFFERIPCLVILLALINGCSYKSITKPLGIRPNDERLLTEESCLTSIPTDTFCLNAVGFNEITDLLSQSKKELNLVCLENTYCPGFYKHFLSDKPALDSIPELSTLVLFEEKYTDIVFMRKRFSILKYYGSHYILDEKDFGRFRDDRTKNKVFLEHFAPNGYKILDTPFSYQESTKSFPTEYHYLSATMYVLFDENLKIMCVSLGISPSDVKRILNGERPLQ
ncbi:MAG: hypothetical protein ACKVOK_06065 [Flavobacteriales bacterium]